MDRGRARAIEARLFGGDARQIRHYVLGERIGSGAHGLVNRAFDPKLRRSVAIKEVYVSSARALSRLEREAQTLAKLSHPNVVQVHESGLLGDDRYFIAMELVVGDSVERWLARTSRTRVDVLLMFAQIADGLHALHRRGIVHRDLKPANVIVGSEGVPKLVDFGLATSLEGPADARHAATNEVAKPSAALPEDAARCSAEEDETDLDTVLDASPQTGLGSSGRDGTEAVADDLEAERTRGFMGTPKYASPEQFLGLGADTRSDQFSFCVALFEALVGRHPFPGRTYAQLAQQVVSVEIDWPARGLSSRLRRLLEQGLQLRPEDRHGSMDEVAKALRAIAHRRPVRRALPWVVSAAAAVGAIAATSGPTVEECRAAARARTAHWAEASAALSTLTRETAGARAGGALLGELDHYVAQWIDARDSSCEAEAAQVPDVDLVTTCLEHDYVAFEQLVSALEEELASSHDATASALLRFGVWMPPPSGCRLAQARAHRADAARLPDLDATISRVRVLRMLGRWPEAEALAAEVAAAARTADAIGLATVADAERGSMMLLQGRREEGTTLLRAALLEAESREHLLLAVEIAGQLAMADAEAGVSSAATQAESALARVRAAGLADGEVEAWASASAAYVHAKLGRWTDAIARNEDALASLEQMFGADDARVAAVRLNLAAAMAAGGRGLDAWPLADQGLETLVAHFGANHPMIARHALDVGRTAMHAGRWSEALEAFSMARTAAQGTASLQSVRDFASIESAVCHGALGDAEAAVASLERATPAYPDAVHVARWAEVAVQTYGTAKRWGAAANAAETLLHYREAVRPRDEASIAKAALQLIYLRVQDGKACEADGLARTYRASLDAHQPEATTRILSTLDPSRCTE